MEHLGKAWFFSSSTKFSCSLCPCARWFIVHVGACLNHGSQREKKYSSLFYHVTFFLNVQHPLVFPCWGRTQDHFYCTMSYNHRKWFWQTFCPFAKSLSFMDSFDNFSSIKRPYTNQPGFHWHDSCSVSWFGEIFHPQITKPSPVTVFGSDIDWDEGAIYRASVLGGNIITEKE